MRNVNIANTKCSDCSQKEKKINDLDQRIIQLTDFIKNYKVKTNENAPNPAVPSQYHQASQLEKQQANNDI